MMINIKQNASRLEKRAPVLRGRILKMINAARAGHPGGSLSAIDIIYSVMVGWGDFGLANEEKDWFVLGKGHAVPALYSVLIELGFLPEDELYTYRHLGSRLQGHPDRNKLPFIQINTGHLGQGLSIGVGLAMAERQSGSNKRSMSFWEMANERRTDMGSDSICSKISISNLIVFIDDNRFTQHGIAEKVMNVYPLKPKFIDHNWMASEIDGHNYEQILTGLEKTTTRINHLFLICHTIKGKGVVLWRMFVSGILVIYRMTYWKKH